MEPKDQFLTPPTILVVDDDAETRLLLEEALADLGDVRCAKDGDEAIYITEELIPDVIILDVYMPGSNGIEVCQHMKGDPRLADIPILFITASEDQDIEVLSLAVGGIDFIRKPIDFNACALRVRNHLDIQLKNKALKLAHDDLDTLVRHLPVHVTLWSSDWNNRYSNDESGQWFGITSRQAKAMQLDEYFPSSLVAPIRLMAKGTTEVYESTLECKTELTTRYVKLTVRKRRYKDQDEGFLVTLYDITSLKRAEYALNAEKERMRITLNSIGDAVIATDANGKVTFINPIAERMTGFSEANALNRSIESIMDLRDASTKEPAINPIIQALKEQRVVGMALNCQLKARTGEVYRVEDSAAPVFNEVGELTGAVIVFHDVSEAIAMAVKMSHLANYDQLTNLPNRILLQDRLEQAFREAQAMQTKVALYLIDIDHFKYLNDSLGHETGDRIIKVVASRLSDPLMMNCTLARIGGDEFIVVNPSPADAAEINFFAERLLESLEEPIHIEDAEYSLSCSMGISIYPDDADSMDTIMRHADVAMYRAKQEGRKRHCFFSHALEESLVSRQQIEQTLRQAIRANKLEVYYQPKVTLNDGNIYGAEALVRLRDADGTIISPIKFIGIVEDIGLAPALGKQVLRKACKAAKKWLKTNSDFVISVNVSAAQLRSHLFTDELAETLNALDFPATNLEIEVTESMLMDNVDLVQETFTDCHAMGIRIAIDDFGTGYSSLSYLKRFRVDTLKIDQSFVRDMAIDKNDCDIVKAVVQLGRSLDISLCAEGIETEEQYTMLRDMACQHGQGYLFGKPMPEVEFSRCIAATEPASVIKKIFH